MLKELSITYLVGRLSMILLKHGLNSSRGIQPTLVGCASQRCDRQRRDLEIAATDALIRVSQQNLP
jgi:hypothetical protein